MIKAISDAIDVIQSSPNCEHGGERCNFYRVGTNSGTKVYKYLKTAAINRKSQLTLHKLGFAPAVLSKVFSFLDRDEKRFMFLTELAVTAKEIIRNEGLVYNCQQCPPHCIGWTGMCYYHMDRFADIKTLYNRLKDSGLNDYDAHWANYGYLQNGNAVVIDCDFVHGD